MIADSIEAKLRAAFEPAHFELENESHLHGHGRGHEAAVGGETHFRLVLVSTAFEGVPRVDRQRRVYALLEDERAAGLHALAMWTYTPAEWAKLAPQHDLESPTCAGATHPERKS